MKKKPHTGKHLAMKSSFNHYRELIERTGDLKQKKADHIQIIESYYANDIHQIENNFPPIEGKEALMKLEEKNLKAIESVSTQLSNVVIDEEKGLAWGVMTIEYRPKDADIKILKEAFMQKWVRGKIQQQQFFYSTKELNSSS